MLTPFQKRAKLALGDTPLLEALPDEELRWFGRASFRKGELLHAKGDPSDPLIAVVEGQVQLFAENEQGKRAVLDVAAPGELIGDLGVLNGAPRASSALALSHCEVATLPERDLLPMLDRYPALYGALTDSASERARRLTERIEDSVLLNVEDRIEKAIVDLAQRLGERVGDQGSTIRLRQQDVADLLGLSRGAVNRFLTSPAMSGRVKLGRGSILILDANGQAFAVES